MTTPSSTKAVFRSTSGMLDAAVAQPVWCGARRASRDWRSCRAGCVPSRPPAAQSSDDSAFDQRPLIRTTRCGISAANRNGFARRPPMALHAGARLNSSSRWARCSCAATPHDASSGIPRAGTVRTRRSRAAPRPPAPKAASRRKASKAGASVSDRSATCAMAMPWLPRLPRRASRSPSLRARARGPCRPIARCGRRPARARSPARCSRAAAGSA